VLQAWGQGRFAGRDCVEVSGTNLLFKKAAICTGARAAAPPIPGLAEAGYLTNETIFALTELPPRLAVIGGGPIGCELAQAFARFGSRVTLIEIGTQILPREDGDAAATLQTSNPLGLFALIPALYNKFKSRGNNSPS
jgi:pyruvate/2-oxoglutarate dehydrogenase complex dihydrolipoamide dehydrogenase (E3) component